jgi:predicted nucleic acid-binding protein
MRNECFLDKNVFIYADSTKIDDLRKHTLARQIFATTDFCTSGQVLAEFVANRKKMIGLTTQELVQWLEEIAGYPVAPVDAALVQAGLAMSERYQISYWDGTIIAAAETLGAPILYSEDLNHGQKYGSVTVINPFKAH